MTRRLLSTLALVGALLGLLVAVAAPAGAQYAGDPDAAVIIDLDGSVLVDLQNSPIGTSGEPGASCALVVSGVDGQIVTEFVFAYPDEASLEAAVAAGLQGEVQVGDELSFMLTSSCEPGPVDTITTTVTGVVVATAVSDVQSSGLPATELAVLAGLGVVTAAMVAGRRARQN